MSLALPWGQGKGGTDETFPEKAWQKWGKIGGPGGDLNQWTYQGGLGG